MKAPPLIALGLFAVVLFAASMSLPALRTADSPIRTRVEPYYIENVVADTATPNIVSAILADYRSFDTFGETTVVFAAGLAVFLLLGRRDDGDDSDLSTRAPHSEPPELP